MRPSRAFAHKRPHANGIYLTAAPHLISGEPRRKYSAPRRKKRDPNAEAGLPELNPGDVWMASDQVAELVNVKRDRIYIWVSRGGSRHCPFPPPEYRMLRIVYWRFSTVRDWLLQARGVHVISPAATSGSQVGELLNIAQIARKVRAEPDTIYGWISRRQPSDSPFPVADVKRQGRNFWRPSTINAWQQSMAAARIVTVADPSRDLEDELSRVQVFRMLAEGRAPDEAILTALGTSDGALAALGCGEGALRECRKTIRRYRTDSTRRDLRLAAAIARSGVILRSLNRVAEADSADREAVKLYRHAMLEPSTVFAEKLADALNSYGRTLACLDRIDAALIVYDEQEAVYTDLMEAFPRKFGFKNHLARVLATHADAEQRSSPTGDGRQSIDAGHLAR
jgi:predicted DNA-binding transcriptional regulator AlpA